MSKRFGPKPRPLEERFWARVDKNAGGCWLWRGTIGKKGYGFISHARQRGRNVWVHRLSWELHRGIIPDGLWVLHKCDVPNCVNPEHLYLGDHKQNMEDARERGRMRRGERHSGHVLTENAVRRMRIVGNALTIYKLSGIFGVPPQRVSKILRGETWKHVHPKAGFI